MFEAGFEMVSFQQQSGDSMQSGEQHEWGGEAGKFWKVHCKLFYHSYSFSEENYFWLLVSGFWLQGKILPC